MSEKRGRTAGNNNNEAHNCRPENDAYKLKSRPETLLSEAGAVQSAVSNPSTLL